MSTVSDWAGLIAPVTTLAGVLGGYWLAGHNDEGRDVRAAQREEAARVADYAKHLWDRRHEWQRQVLLDLQDELQRMSRQTFKVIQQDLKTVREHGKLFPLPEGIGGEESIAATVAVQKLRSRILADDLRAAVGDFVAFCTNAETAAHLLHKDDPRETLGAILDGFFIELGSRYPVLVEQVGEHIRRNELGGSKSGQRVWAGSCRTGYRGLTYRHVAVIAHGL